MLFPQVSKIDALSAEGIKPTVKGDVEFSNIDFVYPTRPDIQVREIIFSCNNKGRPNKHILILSLTITSRGFTSRCLSMTGGGGGGRGGLS